MPAHALNASHIHTILLSELDLSDCANGQHVLLTGLGPETFKPLPICQLAFQGIMPQLPGPHACSLAGTKGGSQ